MSAAFTPADLKIHPRDLKFNRGMTHQRWWHGGDPIKTAYFNALSATFPQGESFFIETVRRYKEAAGPQMQDQIAAFIRQEVIHTREHVVFNRLIVDAGYDTKEMDEYTRQRMNIARERHPIAQLATTVALEHFTAMLANTLLRNPDHLDGAPEDVRRLWQWHAIEEIEHKGVAFDTYVAATKNFSAYQRWSIRCRVMLLVSFLFWRSNLRHMGDFFRQDGINTVGTWLRTFWFLLVKPGIARTIFGSYLSFYRPGFHPWIHDDRELIAQTEAQLTQPAS